MKRCAFNKDWKLKKESPNHAPLNPVTDVTLPHDALFESGREENALNGTKKGFFLNGVWEYTKQFFASEDWKNKHILLEFEGVYNQAMVYINDSYAGQRPFGYSEFYVEADNFLRYGRPNTVKVVARTADDSRWYSGAGIYRNVNLLVSDLLHITANGVRVTIETANDTKAVITVETSIKNLSCGCETVRVKTEIIGADGEVTISDTAPVTVLRGETETAVQRLYLAAPRLWSVENPALYVCKTTLLMGGEVKDSEETRFGVRVLSLDTVDGLQINGKTVKLRGCCIHHDNGVFGARTFASAEYRRIKKLKEAGFNAIRSSHHPASRALLKACDELGMLVMDEAFDIWATSKSSFDYSFHFPEWWERDVEAMVAKDYNHPSVIMYSIGNEIPDAGTSRGGVLGRRIAQKIRALDKTRYIALSLNGMMYVGHIVQEIMANAMQNAQAEGGDINSLMADANRQGMDFSSRIAEIGTITEEAFSGVDVAGYNYMMGRYEADHDQYPNRVIVGSETFTKDIPHLWKLVNKNSHVIGDFAWTGWDYLGETGIGRVGYNETNPMRFDFYSDYPWITGWCGDIDITGFRLPASYYREIVYGLRSLPYIAVQDPAHYHDKPAPSPWGFGDAVSSWAYAGHEGNPVRVEVYANADDVALVLNGGEIARKKIGEKRALTAIFETVYQQGRLEAVAYNGGKETGRYVLESPGNDILLKINPERTSIKANGQDLAYVNITLTDEKGVIHTDKDSLVTLSIMGEGQLIGFGSGSPTVTESYLDNVCTTYKGQALAVILPTGAGSIKISAQTENGPVVTVTITVEEGV